MQETFWVWQQNSTGFGGITAHEKQVWSHSLGAYSESARNGNNWGGGGGLCPVSMQNITSLLLPPTADLSVETHTSLAVWLLYACAAAWHVDWLVTMEWVMDVGLGSNSPSRPPGSFKETIERVRRVYEKRQNQNMCQVNQGLLLIQNKKLFFTTQIIIYNK